MKKVTLLIITLLFFSSYSWAQDVNGFYLKGFGGLTALDSSDTASSNGESFITFDSDFDDGSLFGLATGYRFNKNFALEIEYSKRQNDFSEITNLNGGTLVNANDISASSVLVNALYYFDAFGCEILPYIGFGIGFLTDLEQELEIEGFGTKHKMDSEAFAFQGIIGVEYGLSDDIRLFTEARAMSGSSPDVNNSTSEYNLAYDSYGISAGLSYIF